MAGALVLALAACARTQSARWRDSVSIWEHAVACTEHNALAHHLLASALNEAGRFEEALPHHREAIALQPRSASLRGSMARTLSQLARHAEAAAHYESALELDPGSVLARNNLAWFLATCPDATLRDGPRACALAGESAAADGGTSAAVLDTLAAALAEVGDWSRAVTVQERAVAIAPPASAPEFHQRLSLYRERKPYRSTPAASPIEEP
jgi:Flp pilus assembly protein TadD